MVMDITIPYIHAKEILNTAVIDKDMLNKYMDIDDPEIIYYKQKVSPKIKITFSRLEPDNSIKDSEMVSFPINEDSRVDLVISSSGGNPQKFHITPIKTVYLWDLSLFKKVDILRCGRFKKNDFLPIIKETPLEMDLGVSREHSLICYFDSKVYYVDYGTSTKFLESDEMPKLESNISHFGSKNGSWHYKDYKISDCIKNRCLQWDIDSVVGIGTFFYNIIISAKPDQKLKLFHQFSFKYDLVVENK